MNDQLFRCHRFLLCTPCSLLERIRTAQHKKSALSRLDPFIQRRFVSGRYHNDMTLDLWARMEPTGSIHERP